MKETLSVQRLRKWVIALLTIMLVMQCCIAWSANASTSSKLSVQYVTVISATDQSNTYWSNRSLRGFVSAKQLYVPLQWVQYVTLRSYKNNDRTSAITFAATDSRTADRLRKERNKWNRKGPIAKAASVKATSVKATAKAVSITTSSSRTSVSAKAYVINGTLYLPFRSLGSVFGGTWSWDGVKNIAQWGLKQSKAEGTTTKYTTSENSNANVSPTEQELDRDVLKKLLTLQAECRASLTTLYTKAKDASTDATRESYTSQGKTQLAACDSKVDGILSTYQASLLKYKYDTDKVELYRKMYRAIKEEQRAELTE